MFRYIPTFIFLATALAVTSAHAQKATEIFIPIGKSPGISGKYTLIGNLESVDTQRKTLSMRDSVGTHNLAFSNAVQIWLDRSSLKQQNKSGTAADLKTGRLVEVKFADPQRRRRVEWIKVQINEPGS